MLFSLLPVLSLFLVSSELAAASPLNQTSKVLKRAEIPSYVLTYAPLTHFHSKEEWFSSEITTHLEHTTPQVNFVNVADSVTLATLSSITSDAYLTSKDDPESQPAWLRSTANKPNSSRHSGAPATIIVVDKGNGIVDAFYFYFYSYNRGPPFLGFLHFGNHVGDWEHTMVRFANGVPQNVYLSAHSGGYAYTFDAMESIDGRPVTYIAIGSHANYATAGRQDYLLPFGILSDNTDAGPLWDVTLNYRGYWFDRAARTFTAAGGAGLGGQLQATESPSWLSWLGHWGDQEYPEDDPRQSCPFDIECIYVSGPTGPLDKNLGRTAVCQDEGDCDIETEVKEARVSDERRRAAGLL